MKKKFLKGNSPQHMLLCHIMGDIDADIDIMRADACSLLQSQQQVLKIQAPKRAICFLKPSSEYSS